MIEQVNLSEVTINPNNPRSIKDERFEKLVKSIQEFPEMLKLRPIVVDDNMVVLGGNMRLQACKKAKLKKVWIIKASELTEEQKKEFIIKDNIGFGDWDWEMLANEWETEKLEEWGLDVPQWSKGIDVNNMTDEDVDLLDTFDPIGNSKGLHKIIVIFDNELAAKEWHEKNIPTYEYRKFGGADVSVWHINLSLNYAT